MLFVILFKVVLTLGSMNGNLVSGDSDICYYYTLNFLTLF